MNKEIYFDVISPLNVRVKTTIGIEKLYVIKTLGTTQPLPVEMVVARATHRQHPVSSLQPVCTYFPCAGGLRFLPFIRKGRKKKKIHEIRRIFTPLAP